MARGISGYIITCSILTNYPINLKMVTVAMMERKPERGGGEDYWFILFPLALWCADMYTIHGACTSGWADPGIISHTNACKSVKVHFCSFRLPFLSRMWVMTSPFTPARKLECVHIHARVGRMFTCDRSGSTCCIHVCTHTGVFVNKKINKTNIAPLDVIPRATRISICFKCLTTLHVHRILDPSRPVIHVSTQQQSWWWIKLKSMRTQYAYVYCNYCI